MNNKKNYSDTELEELYRQLEDVTFYVDGDGMLRLRNDWLDFSSGTEQTDIWYWFNNNHSKGIGWLSEQFD